MWLSVARLSETSVAFARSCPCEVETVIAFAAMKRAILVRFLVAPGSSPVEWCNRFVSFGLGYALSWSGVSSCWVGCGVSRDLVRMSRLR